MQGSNVWWLVTAVCIGVVGPVFFFRLRQWKKANAKRLGEEYFAVLAEAIPQIVWTAIPGGGIDYCNQRLYELTGGSPEDTMGWGWKSLIHPDDLPFALRDWESSRLTGKSYEVEYRLRTAAGGYRWHLVRATPLRDAAGNIVKWFGACADIDDQMRHQQLLEDQIKQHTAAIMEVNNRLSSEMRERTLAQQELNEQSERTVRELTKRSNRATNLINMAELLQSCASLEDAFPVIAGMAPKVFPELRGALLRFHSSHEALDVAAIWADCVLPPPGIGMQDCWALRAGRPHIVVAGDYTAECGHAAICQNSYMCLPLLSHGETVGLLHFQMMEPGEFPQPILLFANMFAEQVSLSLANIQLRDALRNQSIRDPLTGLYNRRFAERHLKSEIARARRRGYPLTFVLFDLDNFKQINDRFGHPAGDAALKAFADRLAGVIREGDLAARLGGDEFMLLLADCDSSSLSPILGRLGSVHAQCGAHLIPVTFSTGATQYQDGDRPEDLFHHADKLLYDQKQARKQLAALPSK